MRTNGYPGTCKTCGTEVAAGAGKLLNDARYSSGAKAQWSIYCVDREACQARKKERDATIHATAVEAYANSPQGRADAARATEQASRDARYLARHIEQYPHVPQWNGRSRTYDTPQGAVRISRSRDGVWKIRYGSDAYEYDEYFETTDGAHLSLRIEWQRAAGGEDAKIAHQWGFVSR